MEDESKKTLEYIPVQHDPERRVFVKSCRPVSITGILNVASLIIESCSCAAMVYLLSRIIL